MSIKCDHALDARHHHFGWDRANPPALTIASGETVDVNIVDSGGGQITPATTVADLDGMDYAKFTPMTGPIAVDGAEPGDALKITFLDFRSSGWGWSMITPRYGILTDQFPDPYLKIWHYDPSFREPVEHAGKARIPLSRHFPANLQIHGNRIYIAPPRELHSLRSPPMTRLWRADHVRKAIWQRFPPSRHTSPVFSTLPSISSAYAGTGLRRRSSIKAKIFWNKIFDTATSASWNVT